MGTSNFDSPERHQNLLFSANHILILKKEVIFRKISGKLNLYVKVFIKKCKNLGLRLNKLNLVEIEFRSGQQV